MKKLLFIAMAIIVLSSCKKDKVTTADFSYTDTPNQGEISFTNKSKKASVYTWDFGDSYTSSEKNPSHVYTLNGTYPVSLTVDGGVTTTKDVVVTTANSGEYMFWTSNSSLGQIKIYVDGSYVGTITKYMADSSSPNCGVNGAVTVKLTSGTHYYSAETADGFASGSITVTKNACMKKKLI